MLIIQTGQTFDYSKVCPVFFTNFSILLFHIKPRRSRVTGQIENPLGFTPGDSHIFVGIYKPNSVIDSNLSRPYVATWLKRFFHLAMDTILHRGKDLAVSPPTLPSRLFLNKFRNPSLSALASLLAPRRLL